ncbi:PHP domain-containing protein [candidate division KSB1 bacterium]
MNVYLDRYIPPDLPDFQPVFHTYKGVVHFHSVYSDGGGDFDRIIEAAVNTGTEFLISADHHTYEPLKAGEEGYRQGVLTIVGNEISTEIGHIFYVHPDNGIADIPVDSIFPKFADPYISRGTFITAHPFLPKRPFTQWSWSGYSGFELFNSDYEWRNDSPFELIQTLTAYPFIQSALNFLADTPERGLAKLDSILAYRPCVITGAGDVHAKIKITRTRSIAFPSYERGFRTMQTCIQTIEPFTGNFTEDKSKLISLLRRGSAYAAAGGFCDPSGFNFYTKTGTGTHTMGDTVSITESPILVISVPDTTGIRVVLKKDGKTLLETEEWFTEYEIRDPGVYRTEVYQKRRKLPFLTVSNRPWIFSNPIYIVN